jgi:hypothetical protein
MHTVSGSISLPSEGFFSPFPHGTGSLSVTVEYLALPSGLGRFPQNFTCSAVLRIPLAIVNISFTGLSPSLVSFFTLFYYNNIWVMKGPTTPKRIAFRFGLFPFRSPLLRESHSISFPPGTEMFHFPGFAIGLDITLDGLPHSETYGSKVTSTSP